MSSSSSSPRETFALPKPPTYTLDNLDIPGLPQHYLPVIQAMEAVTVHYTHHTIQYLASYMHQLQTATVREYTGHLAVLNQRVTQQTLEINLLKKTAVDKAAEHQDLLEAINLGLPTEPPSAPLPAPPP